MSKALFTLLAGVAIGGVCLILAALALPNTSQQYERGLFEVGEGVLVSAILYLGLTIVPDKPKIRNSDLTRLGAVSAFTCYFVLLVLHMGWYCHALSWGGSWACDHLFDYSRIGFFVMPMRSILPVPPTAEVSFALAMVFLGLRFGARAAVKWFVIPLLLAYTFVLSFYDPVEMSIQLTSFLAINYHNLPLLSNRFILLMSGCTMELALIADRLNEDR